MDKTFTETYKQSSSGLYVARLFRLPDADDGSMRMSIDVRTKGGYVFFLLTGDYWLGENEQIAMGRQGLLFTI